MPGKTAFDRDGPVHSREVVAELREKLITAFSQLPTRGRSVALVDLPLYFNIGDSLIGLGQFELLHYLPKPERLVFVGARPPMQILRGIDEHRGVILISGGGNFGTVWPDHQRFREHLARELRRTTIIQLPQSIHFDNEADRLSSMRLIGDHEDFHVMVRDRRSIELVEGFGLASVMLVPDSAFAIDAGRSLAPKRDLVFLRRRDSESAQGEIIDSIAASFGDSRSLAGDWAAESDLPFASPLATRLAEYVIPRALRRIRNPRGQLLLWRRLFESRLAIGRRFLSLGRVVVTDRMHAHILCVLLGKPHVFVDNNYRKIERYAESWGTCGPHAVRTEDSASATRTLVRFLADSAPDFENSRVGFS